MQFNVFIYPCSSGIGQEIYHSLINIKNVCLYGGNSEKNSQGKFLYKNFLTDIPRMSEKDLFIIKINEIIKTYNINAIIPAYDDATVYFQEYSKYFINDVKIITACYESCVTCRSKELTYLFFKDIITCPRVYTIEDMQNKNIYPLFIKPKKGSGAINSYPIYQIDGMPSEIILEENIICELLPGNEYTVDCITDYTGNLIFCKARERSKTANGISILTTMVTDNDLIEKCNKIGNEINKNIKMLGAWFFQVKYNTRNELTLLEIAPRIAGAMALYRSIGVNFILLSLYIHYNQSSEILINKCENVMCCKIYGNYCENDIYYENIYVDYDDTIIINNNINYYLIGLLYKLKDKGKHIYLLTRHIGDIIQELNNRCIHRNIFTEIHQITTELKNQYIKKNSILIDDSFNERKSCYLYCNAVYDVDCVQMLINML